MGIFYRIQYFVLQSIKLCRKSDKFIYHLVDVLTMVACSFAWLFIVLGAVGAQGQHSTKFA